MLKDDAAILAAHSRLDGMLAEHLNRPVYCEWLDDDGVLLMGYKTLSELDELAAAERRSAECAAEHSYVSAMGVDADALATLTADRVDQRIEQYEPRYRPAARAAITAALGGAKE